MKDSKRPILIIPDLHAPYQHEKTIQFLVDVKRKYKCRKHVICTGDLMDFHSMSRFATEPDAPSPDDEYRQALEFVDDLCSVFPAGTLVLGNHDSIPQRQMKELSLTPSMLKSNRELYGLSKGWNVEPLYTLIEDGDILVEHGMGSSGKCGALNMAIAKRSSYIQGHAHARAGVQYTANHKDYIFGLNVGCLVDHSALALRYGKYAKEKGVLGCGIVVPTDGLIGLHAEFIPMEA